MSSKCKTFFYNFFTVPDTPILLTYFPTGASVNLVDRPIKVL